jgi:hypothetical protein
MSISVTDMASGAIRSVWEGLPANSPHDVARGSLLPVIRTTLNGNSFLVHGGSITETERKLDETQHLWLGTELDGIIREGQRRIIR